jgi:predicted TPR repeat methyltransferase
MTEKSYRLSHLEATQARDYDSVVYADGSYDSRVWELEQRILREILERYYPHGIRSALDFACGTGRVTKFLAPRVQEVLGIDVSEEMLRQARRTSHAQAFIQGDITVQTAMLAGHSPFDCITCFRFFLNAEPALRTAALQAIRPLLDHNGLLICNNHANSTSSLQCALWARKVLGMAPRNSLSYREMKRLLELNGFEIVEARAVAFIHRAFVPMLGSSLWTLLEKWLVRFRALRRFGIDEVFVARKLPLSPRSA